ncbi:MAG: L-seryl-tRNA(Sec) selenium transferase [Bacteroidales bacterium]|nr:L-seryl-tRNA(Sec) selenium transferase [Bacteroidales bacterium]
MKKFQEELKKLPGVDKLLENSKIKEMIILYNPDLIKFAIRETLTSARRLVLNGKACPDEAFIIRQIDQFINRLIGRKLKKVLNATGIIVHTNLGRAPFSDKLLHDTFSILNGYSNLEYNLEIGERGSRHDHLTEKLKYLTGAEDVLVVNNNAAAVMLTLRTFAKAKEVIVSRGELIEIGGSFRIPEIMAASDCKMKEVGATNKTHPKDYENAISKKTAMLFKAHQSNYVIQGFTKEVSLEEMVSLGKKHKVIVFYDMGSGLLRKTKTNVLATEPDVRDTLAQGVDLVSFSGDKLIGGPQAGIIAGKKKYISILKKEPMVRALRVGKTTLAFMQSALSYYLDEKSLQTDNMIFRLLEESSDTIKKRAEKLIKQFENNNIQAKVVDSMGFCGGGSLPTEKVPSYSVKLILKGETNKKRAVLAEKIFRALLKEEIPVVSVLKSGELYFDMLTISEKEIEQVSKSVIKLYNSFL